MSVPEADYVAYLVRDRLPKEVRQAATNAKTVRELIGILEALDLNEAGQQVLKWMKDFFDQENSWQDLLSHYIWKRHLSSRIPRFLYFDDYKLLPGKVNLPSLIQRQKKGSLTDQDRSVLRLLNLAGVDLDALSNPGGYEYMKARLEATQDRLTRKVFKFWTQNKSLRVEVDIRDDPDDSPPFDTGKNLYLRVYNPRHGVSVAFDLRSKGFIWFFSFIVWFDSIKKCQWPLENPHFWPRKIPTVPIPHLELTRVTLYRAC